MSSVEHLKNPAIFRASGRLGIYLPRSIEIIVCLDTPIAPASSSCVRPAPFLYSLTLFMILSFITAPGYTGDKSDNPENEG